MNNKQNEAFQAFEPENEVKAFIYQQVQDLEAVTRQLGSLAVFIEKEETIKSAMIPGGDLDPEVKEKYAVTFVVAPETYNLQVRAESEDIYEAARVGKEEAQKRAAALINFMLMGEGGDGRPRKGYLH